MIDLHNGDCLEIMKAIPDGSVDCVITDPPYGTTACKWDSVIPFEPMWAELKRIIKPNGAIVLFGSEPFSSHLRLSNIKDYKYDWYWRKSRPSGFLDCKKKPLNDVEQILVFNSKIYYPQGLKPCEIKSGRKNKKGSIFGGFVKNENYVQRQQGYPRRILDFASVHNVGSHPTQKPVALLEYLIKTYTQEGETVLDFTMGSGSTMIACLNTNRKGIGIELDKHYFDAASKRINEHKTALDAVF